MAALEPAPETSVQFLRRVIATNLANPPLVALALHNLEEWSRFLRLRKQFKGHPDRKQRLGNRALWDLLAGAEQKGKGIQWSLPQASSITFQTGQQTFSFHIFAEAQDRRGRARTPGAAVTQRNPTSHRKPQLKKWGPTLRSYP